MGVDGINKADIFDEYFKDEPIYLRKVIEELMQKNENLKKEVKQIRTYEETKLSRYIKALEEIKAILNSECGVVSNAKVVGIINEVLQ